MRSSLAHYRGSDFLLTFLDKEKMGRIIFITGGVRSGKSSYAVKLAGKMNREVIFLATGSAKDGEMRKRISVHRKARPSHWKTIEEGKDLASVLSTINSPPKVLIIDCLTFLVSNLLLSRYTEESILKSIEEIAKLILESSHTAIVVSNEVGWGVVPNSSLGRKFRDVLGKANQMMAEYAQEVYLMVSGIPVKLKYEKGA